MAESLPRFVTRRQPDWRQLAALLDRLEARSLVLAQLGELDRLYRQASADLAHAQTFYPGTDATRFLNQLCRRGYAAIYQRRPHPVAAVVHFYQRQFPLAVRRQLRLVALAAGLTLAGAQAGGLAIAFVPGAAQRLVPDTVQQVVGENRVWTDELLDHVAPPELAVAILTNNLRVMVAAFALGVSLGLGTAALLLFNGLQLGATLTFCFQRGVGWSLTQFMMAHGPVELSALAICGAAGLTMGGALLAAGERPRAEVLQERAAEASKLVLGCAPFVGAIALVEAFVSPGNLFGWPVKLALGALGGAAFWGYLLRAGR